MRRLRAAALAPLALALAAAASSGPGPGAAAGSPVVLELFTSQGCSSCPAADRLLAALSREPGVLPLAFHVDYWNALGWNDPFSSPAWSERQRRYAASFRAGRIYTPQLVVNGALEGVGSDRREVAALLAAARRRPLPARVELRAELRGGGRLGLEVTARLDTALPADRLTAYAVVYEDGLVTPVGSGENARRLLENERVVRLLEPVFEFAPAAGAVSGTLEIGLAPEWRRARLGLAALVQDPASMRLYGAATAAPPDR